MRIICICIAALVLLLVCYRVFAPSEKTNGYVATEQEDRLIRLLTKIDGIDDATVMITEENGIANGAVVIFEGKDGISIRMRVLEITAGALGIEKNAVIVYPAK